MRLNRLALFTACFVSFATSGHWCSAQTGAGNLIALTNAALWEIDRAGNIVTSIRLPLGHRGLGLCPSVDNQGIAVASHWPLPLSNDWYLHVLRGGQLTTLAVVRRPSGAGLQPPQQGLIPGNNARYVATVPWAVGGTVAVDDATGVLTTLDRGGVTAVTSDDQNDGWILFSGGALDHLSNGGARTNLAVIPGMATFGIGSLFKMPASPVVFIAYRGLLTYSPQSRRFTSLLASTTHPQVLAGVADRKSGTLLLANGTEILEADVRGNVLRTLVRLPSSVYGLAVLGANNIQSLSPALRNAPLLLQVSFPSYPRSRYRVGASFGFTPGIPVGVGTLPLNADPLLHASQRLPAVFAGFSGTLDPIGRAGATVIVPGVPLGLRVYFAAMVTDQAGAPLATSEALGVTIR